MHSFIHSLAKAWRDSSRADRARGGRGVGVPGKGFGIREVGDGEKGVLVEDLAVKEPLQEVPRHWCLEAIGK